MRESIFNLTTDNTLNGTTEITGTFGSIVDSDFMARQLANKITTEVANDDSIMGL